MSGRGSSWTSVAAEEVLIGVFGALSVPVMREDSRLRIDAVSLPLEGVR